MKTRTVSLKIRVRLSDGTRPYLNPVFSGNGKLKPLYALVNGKPEHHPEGLYQLRYVREGKRIWEPVGSDPQQALTEKLKREHQFQAASLGLAVPEPVIAPSPERQSHPIAKAVENYLDRIRPHRFPKTMTTYKRMLNLFAEHTEQEFVEDITSTDLLRHMDILQQQGKAPRTVSNHISRILTFLRAYRIDNVLKPEEYPKYDEPVVDAYNEEELKTLFAVCGKEEKELFEFFLSTGFREQEVMFCTWRDVNFRDRVISVHSKPDMGFRPKDCEERAVPVPDSLITMLAERKRHSTSILLFPTKDGKPNGHFLRILKGLALKAGLNCGECRNKKKKSCTTHAVCKQWDLHKFRRTFATFHSEAGVSPRTIQAWLGHANLETTLRYLSIANLRSEKTRQQVNNSFASLGNVSSENRRQA